MPLEGAAQQSGTFGNTVNWVQSPALSLPSNVTLTRDSPQQASASSQGSGGDVVGATTWRAACKVPGTVPGTLQISRCVSGVIHYCLL